MRGEPTEEPIPGVTEAEVAGAVRNLASIPATTLDDHERFLVGVRSLVEARARAGWPNEGAGNVGVFLLVPYPRKVGERFGARAVTDLIATGDPVLGKIFFLNRDASSGRALELPAGPNEILEWLVDNELGEFPVLTVHRNTMLLIARERGAAGDTRNLIIRDTVAAASVEEVYEALRHSHRELLLTPSVCPPGVWEKGRSAEYVPGPHPEKVIQRQLATVLTSWFHGVLKAEMEDPVPVGRIDIRLLRPDGEDRFAYWVVLELKVVRSSHNAKKKKKPGPVTAEDNAAVVAEGVRQSSAFGRDRKAEPFLEVYDLRKNKTEDVLEYPAVVEELGKCSLKPECRVWPLFGTASDARAAGFP